MGKLLQENVRRSERIRQTQPAPGSIVRRSLQKVEDFFPSDGCAKYKQGPKAGENFLKALNVAKDHCGYVLGLDLKDMSRAPTNKALAESLMVAAKKVELMRVSMTGPVSQDYMMKLLREATPTCRRLELYLPKRCKVAIQKEIMDLILSMRLIVLIMFGSFDCVHTVPVPDVEPMLTAVKCPGDSKAKNNFVDVLLSLNRKTIEQLELRDDLKLETKLKAVELENLKVLAVEHFEDLANLEGLNPYLLIIVRGSPREPPRKAVEVIKRSHSFSSIKEIEYLAVMGYSGPGMRDVLKAVSDHFSSLIKLTLIGWDDQNRIDDLVRGMSRLVRLKLKFCRNMDVSILDSIMLRECLPELKTLTLEVVSFKGLTDEQLKERLLVVKAMRPDLRLKP